MNGFNHSDGRSSFGAKKSAEQKVFKKRADKKAPTNTPGGDSSNINWCNFE
jgi:hypothetical protein